MAKKIETVNKNCEAFLRIKVGCSETFKADSVNDESFRSTGSYLKRKYGMRFSVSTKQKGKVIVTRIE